MQKGFNKIMSQPAYLVCITLGGVQTLFCSVCHMVYPAAGLLTTDTTQRGLSHARRQHSQLDANGQLLIDEVLDRCDKGKSPQNNWYTSSLAPCLQMNYILRRLTI